MGAGSLGVGVLLRRKPRSVSTWTLESQRSLSVVSGEDQVQDPAEDPAELLAKQQGAKQVVKLVAKLVANQRVAKQTGDK